MIPISFLQNDRIGDNLKKYIMYFLQNRFFKNGVNTILVLIFLLSLDGCMTMVSRGLKQGYDDLQAIEAVNKIADKHPYIDFVQIFPDTYRFELSKEQIFDKIIRQLTENGEILIKKDRKKGIIFTAAKEAPLPGDIEGTDDQAKIFYQQSIYLTPKNSNVTYVTNFPTVLKGDFREIVIPIARNMLRGIFFGSLAAEVYPGLEKRGLSVARDMGVATSSVDLDQSDTDIIHEIQAGETLGVIAKKYTGNLSNYKKIAEYNNIKDVTKIRVGQKIKIPSDL